MHMPQLLKLYPPVTVYKAPLIITLNIKVKRAINNLTEIRPECKPYSAPFFTASFQPLQGSNHIRWWCDLTATILGEVTAETEILNSINIKALKNKASSIETLHSRMTQGQEHQIAEITQTNLDTIELQWHT